MHRMSLSRTQIVPGEHKCQFADDEISVSNPDVAGRSTCADPVFM